MPDPRKRQASPRAVSPREASPHEASPRERLRALHGLDRWLRVPMIVLSFVWLLLVFAELLWPQQGWLESFGLAIWIVFIFEFALRLTLAPDKLKFMRGNWVTAIALIVPALRMVRLVGVLRF